MPANFPANPQLNDIYTHANISWRWTGSYWKIFYAPAGATGATGPTGSPGGATGATGSTGVPGTSANIIVSYQENILTSAVSKINFVGNAVTASAVGSNVTVIVTGTGIGGGPANASVSTGNTAPSLPNDGKLWFDSDTGDLYIYFNNNWIMIGSGGSGGSIVIGSNSSPNNFTYGNIAPQLPTVGDRWINSDNLLELVYINDGTSNQWIEISGSSGTNTSSNNFTYGNLAPVLPAVGDRWLNSDNFKELVYINDGTSTQWIEISGSSGTNTSSNNFTYGNQAPALPAVGDRWLDSNSGKEFIWVIAGATGVWMQAASGGSGSSSSSSLTTYNGPILETSKVISSNITITSNTNAISIGSVQVNTGAYVAVPTDQAWLILGT
jgi:hypothetical protein